MTRVKTYKGNGNFTYGNISIAVDYDIDVIKINNAYKATGKLFGDFPPSAMTDFNEGQLQLSSGDIVDVVHLRGIFSISVLNIGVNTRMPGL